MITIIKHLAKPISLDTQSSLISILAMS